MKPLARNLDLTATETAGEVILHDTHRQETHRLSPLAALVYHHADGKTSVTEMAALARVRLRRAVSREMVFSALDQLSDAGLLAPAHQAAAPGTPAGAATAPG